ncbi:KH domain-containing protein At4g18375-like [Impatiens glandulifera]|uniref:KH domain-containing protein At4g18375-like n=1 Tax=Impatiens glandulifera TaxID=253017 RepID=UPI001FB0B79A|nr:KH domain-containing protein At4g18375-like [Impatiens glandulifera]
MVEIGKRSRPRIENERYQRDDDDDRYTKNHKKRATDNRDVKGNNNNNNNNELIVYRILCPDEVIGSVIGKNGKVINSVRQETRARVKVVDPFPGSRKRVITICCHVKEKQEIEVNDEFNDRRPLCPAQDALLKMHLIIASSLATLDDSNNKQRDIEECQILVPSSQSATIIGKSGATIKRLRRITNANIKVVAKDAGDPTHSCAMEFDNFVLISGEPKAVKEALFVISTIMYKFNPKEEIPVDTTMPEPPPSIIIPSDVPMYSSSGMYTSIDSILSSRHAPVLGSAHISEYPYADTGGAFPIYSSTVPEVSGFGGNARSEKLTIKVLCPSGKIGRVIGKGGCSIKNIRQSSGALIDVDDAKGKGDDCIITVISNESTVDLKSMAVEALFLLQEKISDEDEKNINLRFLISSKVIGCILGKGGFIVNEIRKRTKADIRISKGEKPRCADPLDELVEVLGEVGRVRDAVVALVFRLRDSALKVWEGSHDMSSGAVPLYAGGSAISMPSVMPNIQPMAPMHYEHRNESGNSLGLLSSNSVHGYRSMPMGDDAYGASLPSYSSKFYGGFSAPSTLEMTIPAYAVDKVVGKGGSNLANIRQISGASIDVISDSRSTRGDLIALISGTSDQKRSAENLIQAFIMAR